MLLLALILVAGGLGLAASGLAQQRAIASSGDRGLANVPEVEVQPPGLVYRVLEPALDAGGRAVRVLSPAHRLDLTRNRIAFAGLEGSLTVERQLSYKAAAALLGLLLGLLGGPLPTPVWAVLLGVAASFVPDVLLSSRADRRQREIGRALPEALDLLALTVEAGLGFEQALEVVVDNSSGPLSSELQRLLREIELGVPRRDARRAARTHRRAGAVLLRRRPRAERPARHRLGGRAEGAGRPGAGCAAGSMPRSKPPRPP